MNSYSVEIKGLDEVRSMLSDIKGGANKAISRALNKTIASSISVSVKKVTEDFNVAQKTVKKNFFKYSSHPNRLVAKIESKGQFIQMGKLLRSRQTRKGVSVQVKKQGKRTVIPHTFIATVGKYRKEGGGHRGIFIREYVMQPGYKLSTKKLQKEGFYAHLPSRKFIEGKENYRLHIKQLFTSSVPNIFGNEEVINPVLEESSEILEKNMLHEADFVLEQAR